MKIEFPLKVAYISVGGHKIRYTEKGEGAPLILIHGLGASLEWWQFNMDSLSKKYRVIAFDFLGFGYSAKPEIQFSLDLIPEFMHSFLDAFNFQKASLVGNSLGGFIAFHSALKMPDRIDRLILVDSAGFGSKLSIILRLGSVFPLGEIAIAMRNRQTTRMLLSQLFYDHKKIPFHLIDCVLSIFDLPMAGKACLQVLRTGVNIRGLREEMWLHVVESTASLPQKTLIIWGEYDRITPVSQAYMAKSLIKNSRLHVFERCGHLPQVEWPEKFNRAVLDFLDS